MNSLISFFFPDGLVFSGMDLTVFAELLVFVLVACLFLDLCHVFFVCVFGRGKDG